MLHAPAPRSRSLPRAARHSHRLLLIELWNTAAPSSNSWQQLDLLLASAVGPPSGAVTQTQRGASISIFPDGPQQTWWDLAGAAHAGTRAGRTQRQVGG